MIAVKITRNRQYGGSGKIPCLGLSAAFRELNRQRQISQSDCEISSNCAKNILTTVMTHTRCR